MVLSELLDHLNKLKARSSIDPIVEICLDEDLYSILDIDVTHPDRIPKIIINADNT